MFSRGVRSLVRRSKELDGAWNFRADSMSTPTPFFRSSSGEESLRFLIPGIASKSFHGFRSLPKGHFVPHVRKRSSIASVGVGGKEQQKLLVTGGARA